MTRSSLLPEDLAEFVPDEPGWIDLKGLLLSGRCDLWSESNPEEGFVARSWDFPFAAVYGMPGPPCILQAIEKDRSAIQGQYLTDEWQLLAPPSSRKAVEAALPDWQSRRVHLYRWEGNLEPRVPVVDAEIRLLPEGHAATGLTFDHVPRTSRYELTLDWVSRRPMAVAIVNSLPVTFCYAAFTTDRLWDVSIETLKGYRRRGLAEACVLALSRHMFDLGLIPAWGAMDNNPASIGLAAKLGFVLQSEIDARFEGFAKSS